MQRKLRLVRDVTREHERATVPSEDRYRYPAHEEIWEVSCESEWEDGEKPSLTTNRRRAS